MVASSRATCTATKPCIYDQVSDKIIIVISWPGAGVGDGNASDPSRLQTALRITQQLSEIGMTGPPMDMRLQRLIRVFISTKTPLDGW